MYRILVEIPFMANLLIRSRAGEQQKRFGPEHQTRHIKLGLIIGDLVALLKFCLSLIFAISSFVLFSALYEWLSIDFITFREGGEVKPNRDKNFLSGDCGVPLRALCGEAGISPKICN